MCGIAGLLHFDGKPTSPAHLKGMTDAIAHRGPDGEGHFTDGAVGLGHRRLAIIDLSPAGHQPMMSRSGRYVMTYNGEVYNFKELRTELESAGFQFHSRSDSEVVLHAYEHWGVKCLDRLNGMFAFAIWDLKEKELFLARDRYGMKPLYYCRRGNDFAFASEVKGILAVPGFGAQLDVTTLPEYFTFQNFFSERSFFKDVHLLAAGHYLKFKPSKSAQPLPVQYWDFHFREDPKLAAMSEAELVEELGHRFESAVVRQLVSDVPVGSYLSGGMDSGAITRIASKNTPGLSTFTVGFDMSSASGIEFGFDEREFAEQISYLSKTLHYEVILKAGDMERSMSDLVWAVEEPRVGQCYPNYYASHLASKFVKVALGGAGGDELFGGYPWRYYRAVSNTDFDDYVSKYFAFWQRLVPESDFRGLLSPVADEIKNVSPQDLFRNVFAGQRITGDLRAEDYINLSLYFEAKTFMNGLLVVEDKLGMAHGLETRMPFLDNDLVDFAQRLPVRSKLANLREVVRLNENEKGAKTHQYFQRTGDGKLILRKLMERYLPVERTTAAKQGFSGPDASWYRGESIEYVKGTLLRANAKIYEFLERKVVERLVNDHLEGRENRRLLIWSLLYFEEWCRRFKI